MSGKTLGQIGYEALQDAAHHGDPTAWTHPAVDWVRPAWETAMQAVAAHVAGPDAADYDSAAEIMRLRDACEADIASLTDQRNRVSDTADQLRAELENQVARGDRLEGKNEDIAADLDRLRERVARAAAKLDADALATAPSRKSDIQAETAARLRETLGEQA